jgi:hypothetical protein
MAEDILKKIIKKKSEKLEILKKTISLESLYELIDKNKTFIKVKNKIENNSKENKRRLLLKLKKQVHLLV